MYFNKQLALIALCMTKNMMSQWETQQNQNPDLSKTSSKKLELVLQEGTQMHFHPANAYQFLQVWLFCNIGQQIKDQIKDSFKIVCETVLHWLYYGLLIHPIYILWFIFPQLTQVM